MVSCTAPAQPEAEEPPSLTNRGERLRIPSMERLSLWAGSNRGVTLRRAPGTTAADVAGSDQVPERVADGRIRALVSDTSGRRRRETGGRAEVDPSGAGDGEGCQVVRGPGARKDALIGPGDERRRRRLHV